MISVSRTKVRWLCLLWVSLVNVLIVSQIPLLARWLRSRATPLLLSMPRGVWRGTVTARVEVARTRMKTRGANRILTRTRTRMRSDEWAETFSNDSLADSVLCMG